MRGFIMVSLATLQDRISNFITEKLHLEAPPLEADLIETGFIDSLALVELIFFVEQEFSIEVPLDEIDHFRSIRSIAALIADGIALRNAERAAS